MGERTSYKPGTFCWAELSTTDPQRAKDFYTTLFGWEIDDQPTEDGTYTLLQKNGKLVAALQAQPQQQLDMGVPPNWLCYIAVDDVNARAEKAAELGGTVLMEPFDVGEFGRMALVSDPTGAVFAMWQPGTHIGASLVNDPGSMSWNELSTRDTNKAEAFYTQLFGWTTEKSPMGGEMGDYTVWKNAGRSNGGMLTPAGDAPTAWFVYFTTEDLDDATLRVKDLGGQVMVPPTEVPQGGRFAIIVDPQGAGFALFEGKTDD
jgi:predicted enzyme related to lactoylglutathione lyase